MRRLLVALEDRKSLGTLLLVGWAAYVTVVSASNLTDLLHSFGWVDWAFRSGNLAYIHDATKIYFDSKATDQVLLTVALAWEAIAALLLWRGAYRWVQDRAQEAGQAGLLVLTGLWFAFAIATEIFVAYDRGIDESTYWILAGASLVSVLALAVASTDSATSAH